MPDSYGMSLSGLGCGRSVSADSPTIITALAMTNPTSSRMGTYVRSIARAGVLGKAKTRLVKIFTSAQTGNYPSGPRASKAKWPRGLQGRSPRAAERHAMAGYGQRISTPREVASETPLALTITVISTEPRPIPVTRPVSLTDATRSCSTAKPRRLPASDSETDRAPLLPAAAFVRRVSGSSWLPRRPS